MAAARVEANDNVKFLAPLQKYFEKLNMADDFPQLVELFKPIIHTLMLIWKHSKHYNTAARLVVLMREISNDLIMQACKFVEGNAIFESPPQDAVEKLRATLKVCGSFKSYYFEYKVRTQTECEENPWRFQNSALFARLDAFLERCHDIQDLTQTARGPAPCVALSPPSPCIAVVVFGILHCILCPQRHACARSALPSLSPSACADVAVQQA